MSTKPKADGQMSGLAGEFFVAAELLKRGLQTSVTFGNAKAIDLFAYNSQTSRLFTVQVKALRAPNYFPIAPEKVVSEHMYVFVLLNKVSQPPEYFVVPGHELVNNQSQFKFFDHPTFPGIHSKELEPFRGNWGAFDEQLATSQPRD